MLIREFLHRIFCIKQDSGCLKETRTQAQEITNNPPPQGQEYEKATIITHFGSICL